MKLRLWVNEADMIAGMTLIQVPISDEAKRRIEALATRLGTTVEQILQRIVDNAAQGEPSADPSSANVPQLSSSDYATLRGRVPWIGAANGFGSASNDEIDRDLLKASGDAVDVRS